ncbi:membrane protein insertion efficiency factor YidD, partial [candidate division WOR-3 bacterium]|nr:membrane protein insertion efficiency factor YidD [candidate division WOR-3 bacterium]
MASLLRLLVRLYQCTAGTLLPKVCRFEPSCSNYALEALRVHGARRGAWLAVRRVLRCHPFTPGGFDPVPGPGERSLKPEVGCRKSEPRSSRQQPAPERADAAANA